MSKTYSIYILASRSRNLYTGVTGNLKRRLAQHRLGLPPGFTSRYRIFRLAHYEPFMEVRSAIGREKEIKTWRREKKICLIESSNRTWDDLSESWFGDPQKRAPEQTDPANARKLKAKDKTDPSHSAKVRPGSG